jgi:hypothetical protein
MNAHDILHYGHTFVTRNLAELPMSEWETENVCGWWSTKNIIAHLASFEYVLIDAMQSFVGGGPATYLGAMNADPGKFNDDQVAARQNTPAQQVYDEYTAQHLITLELLAKIPAETVRQAGTLPWYGPEYALDDFIVYQYYGHKREHTAQINVFKDLLKHSGQLSLDLK